MVLFLKKVIDITLPHIAAYKIQKAFFDKFDEGHRLLENLLS
jgi:ribosomal protein L5